MLWFDYDFALFIISYLPYCYVESMSLNCVFIITCAKDLSLTCPVSCLAVQMGRSMPFCLDFIGPFSPLRRTSLTMPASREILLMCWGIALLQPTKLHSCFSELSYEHPQCWHLCSPHLFLTDMQGVRLLLATQECRSCRQYFVLLWSLLK